MRTTSRLADRARILAPVGLGVVVLVVWQAVAGLGLVSARFLPAPFDIARRLVQDLTAGRLLTYASTTLGEALLGALFAVLLAVPLGYLIARVQLVDFAASPYVAASQALPAIAVAPLLVIWIGYGLTPIAILCAITAFFPMLVTTVLGIRHLPTDVLEAATLDGAGRLQSLWYVEAPLALPSVLAGVRAGTTLSITGAVVGEFTMGGNGLGMLLTLHQGANDVTGMFATLVLLVSLAVLLYTALRLLEQFVVWRQQRSSDRPHPLERTTP